MTEQRVAYTLDSSLETIDSCEEKATRIATELGFGEDEVMQISMAVREGAVNAVLHCNNYAADKKVTLAFERTGEELVIGQYTDQFAGEATTDKTESVIDCVVFQPQDSVRKNSFHEKDVKDSPHDQPDRHKRIHPRALAG